MAQFTAFINQIPSWKDGAWWVQIEVVPICQDTPSRNPTQNQREIVWFYEFTSMSSKLLIVPWASWYANLGRTWQHIKNVHDGWSILCSCALVAGSGCVRACCGETRHLTKVSFNFYTDQQ